MSFDSPFTLPVEPHTGLFLQIRLPCDAPAIFNAIAADRIHLMRGLTWPRDHTSLEHTYRFIANSARDISRQSGTFDLGIRYKGRWIGSVGFRDWDKTRGTASIGYWLLEEFEGQGIMTKSVRALINYGFSTLGLREVRLQCLRNNARSEGVPKRLRMRKKLFWRVIFFYGRPRLVVTYSVRKSKWLPAEVLTATERSESELETVGHA